MRWIYFLFLLIVVALVLVFVSKDKGIQSSKTGQEAVPTAVEVPVSRGGTISGRVMYEGEPPQPQKLMVVKDVAVCGKVDHYDECLVVGTDKGIKNVVVSLIDVKDGKSLEMMGTEFVLDQTGCSYQPHVLLVPINKPVQILNNDGIRHNVHTFCATNPAVNLPHPRFKKRLEMVFTAPERISVRCDIHGWMHSWIIVVDSPYVAVTDAEGHFTITDIPPGTYSMNCWQEVLGERTAQVTVAPGAHVTIDFKYRDGE